MSRSGSPALKQRAKSPGTISRKRTKVSGSSATKRGKNGEAIVEGDQTLVDHVQAAEKVLYDLRYAHKRQ